MWKLRKISIYAGLFSLVMTEMLLLKYGSNLKIGFLLQAGEVWGVKMVEYLT